VVATDVAGNPHASLAVSVTVDLSTPSVTLNDPGTLVHDIVTLSASAPSLAVASVAFDRRPAGGGTWTRIVRDTTRPWGAAFDTKVIVDGLYDLRAQALDNSGQVLATHSREGIRVDNTAPALQSATPGDGSVVGSAASIVLVASEPVAAVAGATFDGSPATPSISGTSVTFSTSPLGPGEHAITGALVDAAGNSGAFTVRFTVRVEAHATLSLRVGKPKLQAKRSKRVFLVQVFLSVPANVQATLLSPTGRKLRTVRTKMSAGQHPLRFSLPAASLPPGRYTIVLVATAADGSRVTKRVKITIKPERAHKPAVKKGRTKALVVPVASATTPPPPRSKPAAATMRSKPAPAPKAASAARKPNLDFLRSKPLRTASSYVNSRPLRSVGLGLLLLSIAGFFAFLIKIELGRILASPRRFRGPS